MAIIKCNACNKFYDNEKTPFCPHCQNEISNDFFAQTEPFEDEKTEYFDESESFFVEQKTEAYEENVQDDEKTIGIYFSENERDPVTGWLVAISGEEKGKSFEIHMNRNFVGRDKLSDVAICADLLVVRNNHFSIIYDNKSRNYFVKSGEGSLLKNGLVISESDTLKENDILEFGSNKYIFVPYCTERRNWEDEE